MTQRFDVYQIVRPRGSDVTHIRRVHNALDVDGLCAIFMRSPDDPEVNSTLYGTLGDALNAHNMGWNRPVHYVVMRPDRAGEAMRAEDV